MPTCFQEYIFGNTRLLTDNVWNAFQSTFEEAGYDVYNHRELVELPSRNELADGASARQMLAF